MTRTRDHFEGTQDADAGEGDFDAFYRATAKPVTKKVVAVLRNQEDAKDVVQDAYETIWGEWAQRAGQPRHVNQRYLLRIASNKAIDQLRRRTRFRDKVVPKLAWAARTTFVHIESDADDGDLDRMLSPLSRMERAVAIKHFIFDLPVAVVADDLGITSNTVGTHVTRIRKKLRDKGVPPGYRGHPGGEGGP